MNKFKVGEKIVIEGEIIRIDKKDDYLPYLVNVKGDECWFSGDEFNEKENPHVCPTCGNPCPKCREREKTEIRKELRDIIGLDNVVDYIYENYERKK